MYGDIAYNQSRTFLELPVEEQRFLFYTGFICPFNTRSVIETEDNVYWVDDTYKPRFNKKLFYTNNATHGIGVDKKMKTVKLWFGKQPPVPLIESFLAYFNVDWMNTIQPPFNQYFGQALATDIVKGKIKNVEDFALFLSKRTLMFKGVNHKLILKLMLYRPGYNDQSVSMDTLAMGFKVAKDPEMYVDYIICNGVSWRFIQEFRDALSVDMKLDFSTNEKLAESAKAASQQSAQLRTVHKIPELPF